MQNRCYHRSFSVALVFAGFQQEAEKIALPQLALARLPEHVVLLTAALAIDARLVIRVRRTGCLTRIRTHASPRLFSRTNCNPTQRASSFGRSVFRATVAEGCDVQSVNQHIVLLLANRGTGRACAIKILRHIGRGCHGGAGRLRGSASQGKKNCGMVWVGVSLVLGLWGLMMVHELVTRRTCALVASTCCLAANLFGILDGRCPAES